MYQLQFKNGFGSVFRLGRLNPCNSHGLGITIANYTNKYQARAFMREEKSCCLYMISPKCSIKSNTNAISALTRPWIRSQHSRYPDTEGIIFWELEPQQLPNLNPYMGGGGGQFDKIFC